MGDTALLPAGVLVPEVLTSSCSVEMRRRLRGRILELLMLGASLTKGSDREFEEEEGIMLMGGVRL